MNMQSSSSSLQKALGFWPLVAFGVGDILGAGIYALVGKIAGLTGYACWLAFLVAMGVAALTALSYAELGGRFPKSGGESYYAQQAFRWDGVAWLVGWLVLCSGVVSMATVSRAFSGYLQPLLPGIPFAGMIIIFLLVLTFINMRGIRESATANLLCTVVEMCGLAFVLVVGLWFLGRGGGGSPVVLLPGIIDWSLILQGGALAFFAFIGFEDMVNVAEEAKSPERDLPKAILTALGIAGGFYLLIAWVAVSVVPPVDLAASSAPLLEVVRRALPGSSVEWFTLIALFAVANTALLNFVMGSRLLYGMAQQKLVPAVLGTLHPTRHTPVVAIGVLVVVALSLALSGSLAYLAGTTSALLLLVFGVVNLALLVLKRGSVMGCGLRGVPVSGIASSFQVPSLIPLFGMVASFTLLTFVSPRALWTALVLLAAGFVLVLFRQLATRKA